MTYPLIVTLIAIIELGLIVLLIWLLFRKRKQFNKVDLDAEVQIRLQRDRMRKKIEDSRKRVNNAETTNDMLDVYSGFVSDLTD